MPTKKTTKKRTRAGKTERDGHMTESDWEEFGMRMAEKWGDPAKWEHHARKGKRMFGLFLLIVGAIWMLSDLGYLASMPMWPAVLILFALFSLLG